MLAIVDLVLGVFIYSQKLQGIGQLSKSNRSASRGRRKGFVEKHLLSALGTEARAEGQGNGWKDRRHTTLLWWTAAAGTHGTCPSTFPEHLPEHLPEHHSPQGSPFALTMRGTVALNFSVPVAIDFPGSRKILRVHEVSSVHPCAKASTRLA